MTQQRPIEAISVLDGRYARHAGPLREIFSEYGLIRYRLYVELHWLKFLLRDLGMADADDAALKKIDAIYENFDVDGAEAIKAIEKETNHDVKAVEYYIKEKLTAAGLAHIKEWVHFACTSDDINNTSYALMIRSGREQIVERLREILEKIEELAREYKSIPMMARTHGQPATPTTVGKEMVNFAWRLRHELRCLLDLPIQAKLNGASGNYNAHHFVFPEIDWMAASTRFMEQHLEISPVMYTTQVNPNNYMAAILHAMVRISAVLTDLDRDMWGYISLGYFKQKLKEGEVGSSTMPHKVNPIDFENSEGNLGLAVSMMEHMAVKLMISRFQRDLSDSTVLRNLGVVFGYMMVALASTYKGLDRVEANEAVIAADLEANPELLAEPVQSAMRVYGETQPYEKLKALTRGKRITREDLAGFVDSLESIPEAVRRDLKDLHPSEYTGLAEALVERYFRVKGQ
ncbi:adenylosuccinate lyase [Desulfosalsimonas propionicica]|uniref:Adenylosuccinate lyase n=1 Tax=Desulfosalsimonas propionicica TaxID=332175 RepID=A0A7W0C9W1_9BACT|nr:adenylosuccinate lyase [Desulfosalsimonas propionicica]MBA2881754.1 adenylosuccinate lyase [Desulfosalsimonas propionicica]